MMHVCCVVFLQKSAPFSIIHYYDVCYHLPFLCDTMCDIVANMNLLLLVVYIEATRTLC